MSNCAICYQSTDGVDEVELDCGCVAHTECAAHADPVAVAECVSSQPFMDTAESVQADG